MDKVEIGQRRVWSENNLIFTVIEEIGGDRLPLWMIQYEDDGGKNVILECAILERSSVVSNKATPTFEGEFHVYNGETFESMSVGIRELFEKAVESNGGYIYEGESVKVKVVVEYCPEDK